MLKPIDLNRADLNLLVLFDTVLAELHVGRAAERMSLTPSAVSHGLGRLRRLLNDPLFLRTPKGVVPTERALELAAPVADILARVRGIVSSAAPFEPGTSGRRFTIGAPDAVSAVALPPLLACLRTAAPKIDISVRQLLPQSGARSSERAWEPAIAELETRAIDIAIIPINAVPARFAQRTLYDEDFVIASRIGHPYAERPTLERFCEMQHLVVSLSGDAHGFVDEILARQGRSRRLALTVPNFMLALAVIADTDLIGALPRRLVAMHSGRFGLTASEAPFPLSRDHIRAIVPKVALMDAGVAWLMDMLEQSARTERRPGNAASAKRRK
jgi:DNA-binding transcriptional LysR family regulator